MLFQDTQRSLHACSQSMFLWMRSLILHREAVGPEYSPVEVKAGGAPVKSPLAPCKPQTLAITLL